MFNEFDPIGDLPLFKNNEVLEVAQKALRDHKAETDWQKFKVIHKERPAIYVEFCRVSEELISRGHKQYSAYGVMHIVRFCIWKEGVSMKPSEEYKVSDHMTPFYARLFLRDFPGHEDFFVTKPIRLQGFKEEWIESI